MTQFSSLVWPQNATTRPEKPSTFTFLAMTPSGFDPTSADASKRTEYWGDTVGTLSQSDVLLAINGLASFQTAQINTIAVSYEAALQAPVAYIGTTFATDLESQTIVAHAILIYGVEGATPAGFYFADAAGNKVPMTLTQLQGLGSAIAANYLPVFQKWTDLKAQVMAATTLAEVQAVVW